MNENYRESRHISPDERADLGTVTIRDEVYKTLAAHAALSVKGIAGMNSTFGDGIAHLLGLKNGGDGVVVEHDEEAGDISLRVHVVVRYGYRVPDVALRLQEAVKTAVEHSTETPVTAVDVFVQGIIFDEGQGGLDG